MMISILEIGVSVGTLLGERGCESLLDDVTLLKFFSLNQCALSGLLSQVGPCCSCEHCF